MLRFQVFWNVLAGISKERSGSSSRIEESKKNPCCLVLARHSATSVHTYQNTRCHSSEDHNFRSHPCGDVIRHSATVSVLV